MRNVPYCLSLLSLLLLISTSSFSQSPFSFNQGGAKQDEYLAVIPYEFVNKKMIISVEVNRKPYRFLVDTGAPTAIIPSIMEELKLSTSVSIPVVDQSGKTASTDIVIVPSISVGGVDFMDIPSLVVDQPLIFGCMKIQGIVGSNLLRNSVVQIDHEKRTIVLTHDNSRLPLPVGTTTELFLTPSQSSPFIWLRLQGKKKSVREQVLFDTGMNGFYDVSLDNYRKLSRYKVFEKVSSSDGSNSLGLNGIADRATQLKLQVPMVQVNDKVFTDAITISSSDDNSKIGIDVLQYGVVTLDYRNKLFGFNPNENVSTSLARTTLPVDFTLNNNRLSVGFIWDESLKSALAVGDIVLRVDEFEYSASDVCHFINHELPFKQRDQITLTVLKTNGEEVTMTVHSAK